MKEYAFQYALERVKKDSVERISQRLESLRDAGYADEVKLSESLSYSGGNYFLFGDRVEESIFMFRLSGLDISDLVGIEIRMASELDNAGSYSQ